VGKRDCARMDAVTTAGAIAFGLTLGALLAQRTSLGVPTLLALAGAVVLGAAVVGAVAGLAAALTVALVTPFAYVLRRIADGRNATRF
jgi:hypothetical protein